MEQRVIRVCLAGVESSGKSTLAHELATVFGTVVVPELLRAHNILKTARGEVLWSEDEILQIMERQRRVEEELIARARGGVIFCDTDVLGISVWHDTALGHESERILKAAQRDPADLYLLAGDEIPFVPDDMRDRAFGAYRPLMHLRYVQALEGTGRPWTLVRGSVGERVKRSLAFLDDHGVHAPNESATFVQR